MYSPITIVIFHPDLNLHFWNLSNAVVSWWRRLNPPSNVLPQTFCFIAVYYKLPSRWVFLSLKANQCLRQKFGLIGVGLRNHTTYQKNVFALTSAFSLGFRTGTSGIASLEANTSTLIDWWNGTDYFSELGVCRMTFRTTRRAWVKRFSHLMRQKLNSLSRTPNIMSGTARHLAITIPMVMHGGGSIVQWEGFSVARIQRNTEHSLMIHCFTWGCSDSSPFNTTMTPKKGAKATPGWSGEMSLIVLELSRQSLGNSNSRGGENVLISFF